MDDRSDLTIDLGEEFELSFRILNDFAIVAADQEGVIDFDWRVDRRVDFKDLLGVRERKHVISYIFFCIIEKIKNKQNHHTHSLSPVIFLTLKQQSSPLECFPVEASFVISLIFLKLLFF